VQYSAKYDKKNAHPFADYCIIHDLSQLIFNNDFEKDLEKWEQVPKENVNNAAKKLFVLNTDKLNILGKNVRGLII
jgi:hypothetical protein